jgi:thioredoxin 1
MTAETLHTIINNDIALVDFSVSWCAPCRIQAKIISALTHRFSNRAAMAIMDLDADRQLAVDFFIQSVPTVILFQNGKEVRRFVGLQSEETLQSAIQSALEKQSSKRQRDA